MEHGAADLLMRRNCEVSGYAKGYRIRVENLVTASHARNSNTGWSKKMYIFYYRYHFILN